MIKTYYNLGEMEKDIETLKQQRYMVTDTKATTDGGVTVYYKINFTQLIPCDEDKELAKTLNTIESDNDLVNLGFSCRNQLILYKGYENFNDRLWVWCREYREGVDFKANIVVAGDIGNGNCIIVHKDTYLTELLGCL